MSSTSPTRDGDTLREITRTTEELAGLAQQLQTLTRRFKLA